MLDPMNTVITIVCMAVLMPLCVIAGVFVGHKLTIRSQKQPPTNEQNNRSL